MGPGLEEAHHQEAAPGGQGGEAGQAQQHQGPGGQGGGAAHQQTHPHRGHGQMSGVWLTVQTVDCRDCADCVDSTKDSADCVSCEAPLQNWILIAGRRGAAAVRTGCRRWVQSVQ